MAAIPLEIDLTDIFVDVVVGSTPTTGPFTFDFAFFDELSDIKIKRTDDGTGVVTDLTITTDYTVTGTAVSGGFQGGTVTLTSTDSDATLTIYRNMDITRTDWFPSAGPFDIQTLNVTLARIFAIAQELSESFNRAVNLGVTEGGSVLSDLPPVSERANKLLGFDGAGDVQMLSASGAGDLLSTLNLSDLDNAATARTNLGVAIGVDVQAYDADLTTWAGVTPSANGQSLVSAANYAAMKALLDLEIGTDVQAQDAGLDDISGLAVTDGNIIVGDGTNWVAESGATARTSLGVAIGSDVQAYDADTAKTDVEQNWTAAQQGAVTSLTDAASIAIELSDSNNFSVTLAGNRTLANPTTTPVVGQSGIIAVNQDATGSRTLAFSSNYVFEGGTAPTLTTTASATDILCYYVISTTEILITSILDVK